LAQECDAVDTGHHEVTENDGNLFVTKQDIEASLGARRRGTM
jgi:hypothetical protein